MKRRCLLILALLVLGASTAHAEPATDGDGKAEAARATKAFEAQSYRAAAEEYESAFAKVPNTTWLYNAARARQKNGELAKAANLYARFLKETPETNKRRGSAKRELAALDPKLGRLELKAEGATTVTLDGAPIALAFSPFVYVTADAHLVEARFGDRTVTASPTTPAGQLTSIALARPIDVTKAAAAAPDPVAATSAAPALIVHETPRERARPLPPLAVWIGGGATIVLGGLTVFSGLDVLSQKDTFDTERSPDNLDAGRDKQMRTNILLVATAATAVSTTALAIWFVDWRRDTRSTSASSLFLRGMF